MRVAVDDDLWSAIGDPTRRRLLDLLLVDAGGTATSLSEQLPVTRQAVAKHRGVLDRHVSNRDWRNRDWCDRHRRNRDLFNRDLCNRNLCNRNHRDLCDRNLCDRNLFDRGPLNP